MRNQRFELFIHKNQHNFINFTHTKNPRKITKLIEKLPNDGWNTIRNGVETTLQLNKNPLKCQDGFLTRNNKKEEMTHSVLQIPKFLLSNAHNG